VKAVYKRLVDKSVAAAVAAIEVYNKRHFQYREESFVILLINAWELLLKAKILKESKNKVSALYARQGHRLKRSRSGNPLTIDLFACIRLVALDERVSDNLNALVEIRDTAVHFFNDERVRYLVFTLGVAALKNYQRLVREWFERGLSEYHFFILPLGFSYDFRTIQVLELEKAPAVLASLFKSAAQCQEKGGAGGDGFAFACEIATELRSAKKFVDPADMTVKIDQGAAGAVVVVKEIKRKLDQYPLSYTELFARVRAKKPGVKQQQLNEVLRRYNLKKNERYCAYSFRTKAQEEEYQRSGRLPSGATSIYNEEAVQFVVQKLEEGT
jgi:hypothetical protein